MSYSLMFKALLYFSLAYFILYLIEIRTDLIKYLKRLMPIKINRQKAIEKNSPDVIQLIIKPREDQYLDAIKFEKIIKNLNLVYGQDKFFHKVENDFIVYTLCHLYEPGTFTKTHLAESSYSGCKFFFIVDADHIKRSCFDKMIEDAFHFAVQLDCCLYDELNNQMTSQSINYLRQRVAIRSYHKTLD
jgi:FtsZ-interacting cell division protein ZipA